MREFQGWSSHASCSFFRSVLLTASRKLNTGPWPNQTKALAELRRKCGKCLANSSALQIQVPCEITISLRAHMPCAVRRNSIASRLSEHARARSLRRPWHVSPIGWRGIARSGVSADRPAVQ
jgi:hypothetical protein